MPRTVAVAAIIASLAAAVWAADPPKPTDPPPVKGILPRDFKKLGLSDDQKAAIDKITGTARAKVADLEQQIQALRDQEHKDTLAVLTPDQRKHLDELLTGEKSDPTSPPPPPPPPTKDKP